MNGPAERALKKMVDATSKAQAARDLGVSRSMVGRVLDGTRKPGGKLLSALGFETRVTKSR